MIKSSVKVRRGASKRTIGAKYLAVACSLSALISACVGVVDSGSGTDPLEAAKAGAVGVSAGGSSPGAGVPGAGASNLAGNSAGSAYNAGGAYGAAGGFGTAGAGNSNNAEAGSFSSGGDTSRAGSSFGGSASGGRNGMGGGASGGRTGGGAGAGNGSAGSTAVVCTSKSTWTNGNGPNMRPGAACRSCHNFTIAGTIYPTAHEPINCNGLNGSGVKVVVTGSDGTALTLTPGSTGNFYSSTKISTPYKVTITSGGTTRMMLTPQTSGDCNSCHTQNGANGAPGRIMAP